MRDQPRARGIRPFLTAAASLVAASAWVSLPSAQAREPQRVDGLKAGYLFNFLKFVEWPPLAPADILTLCLLGESGVYEAIAEGLAEKRVGARRIVARRISPAEPLAQCQVLYIDAGQFATVSGLIAARPTALLTVSDAPDFLHNGGIISLFDEGNRLRFRISVDNARRADLRISSNLLQLASAVEREG